MKPLSLFLASCCVCTSAAAQTRGYYRTPTLHGDAIVFSSEGDLWRVGTSGGLAMRLTRDGGNEANPRFSPDGAWVAFSGSYEGNVDVYLMPASGGEPRRLTWHPDTDEVVGWAPDSTAVVFRGHRRSAHRDYRLFSASLEGGLPKPVELGMACLADWTSDSKYVAFNRFSRENRTWKRYYGGTQQDIWVGDLERGEFAQVTDWTGTDRFPMWDGQNLYFVSDRSGTMNVWSVDFQTRRATLHTHHETYDARWPDLEGSRVVYMHGADIHLLDLASGEHGEVPIELPSDRIRHRPRKEDASKTVESYRLSHDGERIVVSARGELWIRPVDEGRVVQLTRSPGVRERSPAISPDGKQVVCLSDETGEQQLALFDASGREPVRILAQDRAGWMNQPTWSPAGKHLAWSDLSQALFVMEVESGSVREVDRSPVGEISSYAFSPDGEWIAYSRGEDNQQSSVYLYDVASGTRTAVTNEFTQDYSPAWDPGGKYLYFLSDRHFNPILGRADLQHIFARSTKVCAVILQSGGPSPFLPDELLAAVSGESEQESDGADESEDPESVEKPESVEVDLDGIDARVVEFPLPAGTYSGLSASEGKVYYLSSPLTGLLDFVLFGEDPTPRNSLHVYDLKAKKDEVALPALRDYTLSGDGKKIAWRTGQEILVASLAPKPSADGAKRVDPSKLPLKIDPPQEWAQIFAEAWRLQRDFFWAENLTSVDWDAMRAKYEGFLPRVSTRSELNDLIGQLIGELGTSHTYVMGGDVATSERVSTGLLGADLVADKDAGALRFAHVLRPEVWETSAPSPLRMSHVDVSDGDYLFAINGVELGASDNPYKELEGLAGEQVQLTVGTNADKSDARDVQIAALHSDSQLRYLDWCRQNREYVDRKSGGRLGYFHMPDMMGNGLVQFAKGFYPQIQKEGLVIDARYNGGGFVSQMVIERLMREPVAYGTPRRGPLSTNPARTHVGHKVCLTNQLAGSDGDIFPRTFQLRGIGPVIGMRTWGGVVGISPGRQHVDGGMTTQPTSAWWEPEQGYGLENGGVTPDIEVDILPADWIAGRDPQLDRAIDELLLDIAEDPVKLPDPPAIPDNSRGRVDR